jgi:hypothetical protein
VLDDPFGGFWGCKLNRRHDQGAAAADSQFIPLHLFQTSMSGPLARNT